MRRRERLPAPAGRSPAPISGDDQHQQEQPRAIAIVSGSPTAGGFAGYFSAGTSTIVTKPASARSRPRRAGPALDAAVGEGEHQREQAAEGGAVDHDAGEEADVRLHAAADELQFSRLRLRVRRMAGSAGCIGRRARPSVRPLLLRRRWRDRPAARRTAARSRTTAVPRRCPRACRGREGPSPWHAPRLASGRGSRADAGRRARIHARTCRGMIDVAPSSAPTK